MSTFHVLHVCVANICRSPLAERLTRREIAGRPGFAVHSAGTRGLTGQPMHQHGADLLRAVGADPDGFVARRLTPDLLAHADLVLTATAVERDRAVAMLPAALRTTFTLLEFARLLAGVRSAASGGVGGGVGALDLTGGVESPADPVDRARALVTRARGMRGRVPYVDPAADDVADPVRTPEGFRACHATIGPAVSTIVSALCGEPAEPALPHARTPALSI
jgi:protein-tyrosine phosphatase